MGIATVKMNIPEKIYTRDPEQTNLGRKIIGHSIRLIDELGFEGFTFKKLAIRIDSTEASVYRYFDNKHNLLVYLTSWYWSWLEYQIDYQTNNITDVEKRLRIGIKVITERATSENSFPHINEDILHKVVIAESPKAYYTKHVDNENQDGFYRSYKSLCKCFANLIKAYNPNYANPHALATTLLQTSQQQVYFSMHLPSMTEIKVKEDSYHPVIDYLEHVAFTLLDSVKK
ncbi:MAG: TetR/AcrR family transcriptional regulator [Bacteroidetes bacterium]|nr:MAG: TetR/AcrR family transcriptional regulator [Bacteroidota bacterium]TAG92480.1 MAG: TetR/AcrR family transcriptional regulator [Bacteroidota bacterium]